MTRVFFILLLALASCSLATAAMAREMTMEQYEQTLRDQAAKDGQAYADILAQLRDKEVKDWDEVETGRYLTESLNIVYSALIVYRHENQKLPLSPSELKGSPFLTQWPLNPFNNWEPMRVLGPDESFSAGDLSFQICPPEFYSYIGATDDMRPMSLELGVYGPSREFANSGSAATRSKNSWAKVPDDTYYMLGAFRETAEQTARKLEKRRQRAKEQPQQNQEVEGNAQKP